MNVTTDVSSVLPEFTNLAKKIYNILLTKAVLVYNTKFLKPSNNWGGFRNGL